MGGIDALDDWIRHGTTRRDADVVVIGAGPVGLAVARACAGSGRRVLLVESGGTSPDPATDDLATGQRANAFSMLPIPSQQARCVGGNSQFWHLNRPDGSIGVRLVEMDDVDFERRDVTGGVGWPFGKEHLRPWYRAAAEAFGIADFASLRIPDGVGTPTVTTGVAQVPLADTVYRTWVEDLRRRPDVDVLTGATALRLVVGEHPRRVSGVEVCTLDGARALVGAADVVVAGGGYDNARFLLAQDPLDGTPLGSDQVTGRYLQDHPLDFGDHLLTRPADRARPPFSPAYDMHLADGAPRPDGSCPPVARIAYLTVRSDHAAAAGLPGMSTWLYPRRWAMPIDKGPAALRYLTGRGLAPGYPGLGLDRPVDRARAALTLAANLPSLAHWASGERLFANARRGPSLDHPGWPTGGSRRALRAWELVRIVEQPARAHNRVRLSADRDRLGRPRILVDWRWDADDHAAALRTKAVLDDAVRPHGRRIVDERLTLARPGAGHIIGSTRMHPDPALGVVDADCRVHGLPNLWVAGSSVFPTGGWANPTFTAVALALRLGHTLGHRCR